MQDKLSFLKHRGKYLACSYLEPDSRAQMKRLETYSPSHGSLARGLATEDDCNPLTDKVYTNAEIVIITFPNARLNQYLKYKASPQSPYHEKNAICAKSILREFGDSCGRIADILITHGQPTKSQDDFAEQTA